MVQTGLAEMGKAMGTWPAYGALRGVRQAGVALLDALLPPTSPFTGALVSSPGAIEPHLWAKLRFLAGPKCVSCGFPFDHDPGPDVRCAACVAKPPVFDRARSALAYDDFSRRLVLDFKHGGRTEAVPVFAAWMATACADIAAGVDVLAPIPLHWRRRLGRRYNQAALLTRALAKRLDRPARYDWLVRRRATPSQAGKSALGRSRNVRGAFEAPELQRAAVRGANILLVDDVYTTGATLNACARALKKAGAGSVRAVTLARVVRAVDPLT